jgi:hypothetical protein
VPVFGDAALSLFVLKFTVEVMTPKPGGAARSRGFAGVGLLLLISAAACISFWVLSYDGDERNVFRVAVEKVHGSDGVEHYVLRANTGPCTPFGMSSFHRKKLAVPVSANVNFWIKNFICWSLPANLPLKHPHALASEQDLQLVYTSANPDAKTALLQTKIVESYGIVALSRVGFNLTHTRAVIYVELLYCGLCGGGQYYYLAKQNGAWRVIDVAGTWIS